jgi:hypothetical protein
MPFVRDLAGQVLFFYAFDADGNPVTGDAANLAGKLSLDGGSWNDLDGVISEDAYGWYKATLAQAETNGGQARIRIVSTTPGVRINPIQIFFTSYTENKAGYLDASIAARPINPVLDNDARLDNLDATISSRSTATQGATKDELDAAAAAVINAISALHNLSSSDVIQASVLARWSKIVIDKDNQTYTVYGPDKTTVLIEGDILTTDTHETLEAR